MIRDRRRMGISRAGRRRPCSREKQYCRSKRAKHVDDRRKRLELTRRSIVACSECVFCRRQFIYSSIRRYNKVYDKSFAPCHRFDVCHSPSFISHYCLYASRGFKCRESCRAFVRKRMPASLHHFIGLTTHALQKSMMMQ